MKILFAIKALENVAGGAERVLAEITSVLASRNHDISVLTFDRDNSSPFYPLNPQVRHIRAGIGNVRNGATLRETIARMFWLRRTVREEKPDVVIAFMHSMFVPAAFAVIGTNIPLIASEHIVPAHYKTRRLQFALLLASSLFIKKMTVLSENIKASYPRFLHRKMVAIANPVRKIEAVANSLGADTTRKIILNIGRLEAQKDQETLIKAFAGIASNYPDWDVRIIGEGQKRKTLEALISQLGLKNRVFLPGITKDIETEYQHAQIFALPSLYESFGLATAEAMAHGLPVIGFETCPGTNELITHDHNGLLVNGNNRVHSFSRSLIRLMDNADLRVELGRNARNSIENYCPERIADDWEALIKSCV